MRIEGYSTISFWDSTHIDTTISTVISWNKDNLPTTVTSIDHAENHFLKTISIYNEKGSLHRVQIFEKFLEEKNLTMKPILLFMNMIVLEF